ncbi:hypothetical protein FYJ85_11230 [Victivallaceae bacterium BBE-744-WT-12]|uniref:Uncharacterized protein n=1 Tax=Victivallis lenta TaxID=2606640 RepID=A0A844G1N8_9BACT|nr:hypothetical protein [Victivallis lenta]MST97610.1 hypothetical protein [Victivallis lenta]
MKQKRKANPELTFQVYKFGIHVKCHAGDYFYVVQALDEKHAALNFRAEGKPGRILTIERLEAVKPPADSKPDAPPPADKLPDPPDKLPPEETGENGDDDAAE